MDPNLTLPLLLAGASLAAAGVLRLAKLSLLRMPKAVAATVTILGVGVAALGLVIPPAQEPSADVRLVPTSPGPPATPDTSPAAIVGAVSGTVRTASGEPVAGADVVLDRFDRTERAASAEATTDADGSFSFGELPVGATTAYVVRVSYDDAVFGSDLILLGPHASAHDEDVTVAPTTEERVLRTRVDSTVVVSDESGVQVVHIVSLSNPTDEAYAGGVDLPIAAGGAAGLVPRQGLKRPFLDVADGVLRSTEPVLPGEHELIYEYAVAPRERLTWTRELDRPVERLELLASGDLLPTETSGLRDEGEVELGQDPPRIYRRWSATDLPAGTTIDLVFERDTGPGVAGTVAIGLAVAVAVGLLVVPLVRRRRLEAPLEASDGREPAAAVADADDR